MRQCATLVLLLTRIQQNNEKFPVTSLEINDVTLSTEICQLYFYNKFKFKTISSNFSFPEQIVNMLNKKLTRVLYKKFAKMTTEQFLLWLSLDGYTVTS